jgi:hypothetical protein
MKIKGVFLAAILKGSSKNSFWRTNESFCLWLRQAKAALFSNKALFAFLARKQKSSICRSKAIIRATLMAVLCINGNVFAVLSGGGTQANPYLIQSRADFDEFANPANSAIYWNVYTKLMCDLNLSDTPYTQAVIAPDTDSAASGFQGTVFDGIFDGSGHVINALTLTTSTEDFTGLFGYLGQYAQIRNLGVENVNITGRSYVGGLAGCSGFGKLTACYATGSVSGIGWYVGGLVGKGWSGALTDCYATCSVSGINYVGGLVGESVGSLNACYATGSVTGTNYVGGLAGYNSGSLTACYATGSVIGTDTVGGLVGFHTYNSLNASYATGSVSGTYYVGGLVGFQNQSSITNCYSAGAVSGIGSYSAIGGLLGKNWGSLTGCFWDIQTSGKSVGVGTGTSTGGTGKSTADMKKLLTFTSGPDSWDFTNETTNGTNDYWRMCTEDVDYPRLNWQSTDGDLACSNGVNIGDLDTFIQRWLMETCTVANNFCGGADINKTGMVNLVDFAILAENWLAGI